MKDEDYAFAVARIRANEARLLTKADFDALISAQSLSVCYDILASKNRINRGQEVPEISSLVSLWSDELWQLLSECAPDKNELKIFSVQNDFFNLKAALKCSLSGEDATRLLKSPTSFDKKELQSCVSKHDFEALGEPYATACREAYEAAVKTENGQSADIILDKATLELMSSLSKSAKDEITRKTLNFMVACADVKIALRSLRTGKDKSFVSACLCDCEGLDIEKLAELAVKDEESLFAYLSKTEFAKGVSLLKENSTAFEKWCDDTVTEITKAAKFAFFGFEPIIAYYFAKTTEIKMLRLILCAKQSKLPETIIRERMRQLYV